MSCVPLLPPLAILFKRILKALVMNSLKSLIRSILFCICSASMGFAVQTKSVPDPPFELLELEIPQLQKLMESGTRSSKALTQLYLDRIETIDRNGHQIRSVIEINPDAITIAAQLDQERKAKGPRGPLHGVPILIKDNIDTADNMSTTAGSLALIGPAPDKDAFIVQKLRAAGAVILGKTNLSEWANIRSEHSTSGWSGRGGQTRNPYVLDRNPCGSSSGSGAAVSSNLCSVAIGTETNGSIVCPSSACGIVGIKPTVGLISRAGIIPISSSQDTAGPMARTVRDAAILLAILAGEDSEDSATLDSHKQKQTDYTQYLDAEGLKGARIGVARNFFKPVGKLDKIMDESLQSMRDAGAELIDFETLKNIDDVGSAQTIVLQYELKASMADYFAHRGNRSPMKSLADLIEFNLAHRDVEMKYFAQDFFEAAQRRGPLTDFAYLEAQAKCLRLARTEGIDAAMEEHKLDAIIAPTLGPACPIDLVNGDHWLGGSTDLSAISGYPSISVPGATVQGLPVGLTFMGKRWSEPTLIKFAYAFEQKTKIRKPPEFIPSLNW
jgi:amidase